jgi:ribosomal protein L3 glutamine methyltransferase
VTTQLRQIFDHSVAWLDQHDVFYGHGVAQAEDEVLLLLMHVMQVDFVTLNQMAEAEVSEEQQKLVARLLAKRVAERKPMAYIVGFSVFAGLTFDIDERALIPRSPFVELIDQGFAPWVDMDEVTDVLDMCTGSGCIGLAVAHHFPHTCVDLVDINQQALELAAINRKKLHLTDRTQCLRSDLFNAIGGTTYDLIIANPPYVDDDEYQALPEEYSHEPRLALVSERQGMELPVSILAAAANHLTENGYLFLEVGCNDEVLNRCLPGVPVTWVDLSVGGQGIGVFSRQDLLKYQPQFTAFLDSHVT